MIFVLHPCPPKVKSYRREPLEFMIVLPTFIVPRNDDYVGKPSEVSISKKGENSYSMCHLCGLCIRR